MDSQSFTGWHKRDAELELSHCVTVGIIQERGDSLRITQSFSDMDNATEEIAIPKVAVKRIRYLKVRK